ncbi:MAG TPA: hypothetical protein VLB46_11655 [Pyrinomonadaceae bacterium]|nr:hypothetical protein [Pyrinomonadaceae bacterium]
MDQLKRDRLIARLSQEPEPQIIDVEEFFDGNDDLGSIGCNLLPHPGLEAFRDAFARLAQRPDVKGVYAQIFELDPGEGCWPFTDTVLVVGSISVEDVAAEVSQLQPDEIVIAAESGLAEMIARRFAEPVVVVWWD